MGKPGQELVGHSGNDEIATPRELFAFLDRRFLFDYDAFASHENHLCPSYSTPDGTFLDGYGKLSDSDALARSWETMRVFYNPPYSQPTMRQSIEKAIEERNNAEISVGLVKCDTSTKNWELIERYFHVEFQPRIKYGGMKLGATFASAIIIVKPDVWRPSRA